MPICKYCNQQFKRIQYIDGKSRDLCKRSYCLSCKPFGCPRDRRQLRLQLRTEKQCCRCKTTKSINQFYIRSNHKIYSSYCISCWCQRTRNRKLKIKQQCIEYKGGKCILCGYNKCLAALEFHHKERPNKLFTISDIRYSSFERLLPELDKCDLVCSNCHREIENN